MNPPVVPVQATTIRTWPTPLYQVDLNTTGSGAATVAHMNEQLRTLILDAESREGTTTRFGVIGAQKSSIDFLLVDHPAVHWLKDQILRAIRDLTLSALSGEEALAKTVFEKSTIRAEGWAVVYHRGGSHRQHTHHDSQWSGTYYIETGGVGPDAGLLQLLDPRPAAIARSASPGVYAVQPKPGVMVAFPSWLPHSVKATLDEDGTRICVAWNASLTTEEALS